MRYKLIDILNEQKQQELLEQIENGRKAKIALPMGLKRKS